MRVQIYNVNICKTYNTESNRWDERESNYINENEKKKRLKVVAIRLTCMEKFNTAQIHKHTHTQTYLHLRTNTMNSIEKLIKSSEILKSKRNFIGLSYAQPIFRVGHTFSLLTALFTRQME